MESLITIALSIIFAAMIVTPAMFIERIINFMSDKFRLNQLVSVVLVVFLMVIAVLSLLVFFIVDGLDYGLSFINLTLAAINNRIL